MNRPSDTEKLSATYETPIFDQNVFASSEIEEEPL